jgi:ATP-dependent Clp protease ATP-binding subunit ClpA
MTFVTDMLVQHSPAATPSRSAELRSELSRRIKGQPDAVDAVVRAVTIAESGLADPTRPLGCLLFVGSTGVGKTEMVRQLAAGVRSGPDDFCRVDMSALSQEHYAASFSGAPPGYSGSKEALSIFDRDKIEGDAFGPGIVLFDEIEKAHPTVVRSLLHVLDNGVMRMATGAESIDFRKCLIIMTSNLGGRELRVGARLRPLQRWNRAGRKSVVMSAVEEFFDPEFFNRIDEIVEFRPLSADSARAVVDLQLDDLRARSARRHIHLVVSESVVEALVREGFDENYGARAFARTIRKELLPLVAEALQSLHPTRSNPVTLQITEEHIDIRA